MRASTTLRHSRAAPGLGPHLRRGSAHICAGTRPTSAPGLGPHLRRGSAHICTGTRPTAVLGLGPHLHRDSLPSAARGYSGADCSPCEWIIGTAYGLMTAVLNGGTAAFPLVEAAIFNAAGQR